MVTRDDFGDLRQLLAALQPFFDRLVVIGGWAHRLYRFGNVALPTYEPIFTTDTDIAIPNDGVVPPDSILARLQAHGLSRSSSAKTGHR